MSAIALNLVGLVIKKVCLQVAKVLASKTEHMQSDQILCNMYQTFMSFEIKFLNSLHAG